MNLGGATGQCKTGAMHERAGTPARPEDLIDVDDVIGRYHTTVVDPGDPDTRVIFGTSGHRGRSLDGTFTDTHVAAITQAVIEYRKATGIDGPVFVGADTHALSAPALETVLAVLAGNGVTARVDSQDRPTPTPAVSHAIIAHNKSRVASGLADGIIITPSHNPPADGGIKYNPPHGGPAEDAITAAIADRANGYLVRPGDIPRASPSPDRYDFVAEYVSDLDRVIDMGALARLSTPLAVHPLGGASVDYWRAIADTWTVPLEVVDSTIDPQFGFMTLDHDGAIRMDPSSPHAMAVIGQAAKEYPLLVANDADADRHGIHTPTGLMNPNHFLAVAIDYLLTHRPGWDQSLAVGKTMVSSTMIDRVVAHHDRTLVEVPVGFKWFGEGLTGGSLCFAGEESAGAVSLARDGSVWVSEKDGIMMGLLAAEILAVTGSDPASLYRDLEERFGQTFLRRRDFPASSHTVARLKGLTPSDVIGLRLGENTVSEASTASPEGAPLGGIRMVTESGWVAARPSGTEPIYKIYGESFVSDSHLETLLRDAAAIVTGETTA